MKVNTTARASSARGSRLYPGAIAFSLGLASHLSAQDTASTRPRNDTTRLAVVTVIGTHTDVEEERAQVLRIPGSIAIVPSVELRATRQANMHDVLRFVPGVYVQPRFGTADESQISIRGSGLRNNFHARGVNLLVNGMPYRNADGFTDFESLELLTTDGVDVYKGANALRFGGSTLGGAINLHTFTGYTAAPFTAALQGGANGFAKGQIAAGGVRGQGDWYASMAHTEAEGYRAWSDQRRDRINLHAGYRLGQAHDIRAFYFGARVREHLPGSLDAATLEASPQSADPGNVSGHWGREYELHHLGVQYRVQLSPNQRLEVSPYLQYRDIDHPIFEVISQITQDWGAELRYENTTAIGGLSNRLTIGVQPALGNIQNKQFQNVAGKHGNLTRDEWDRATTLAVYAENGIGITDRLTATAGLRFEQSGRRVDDHFFGNGDQSDERTYTAFSPRVGVLAQLSRTAQLFANASRTVEPPLMLELTSFGNSGGFIPLEPQSAWQYELGGRSRAFGVSWEASLYDIELRNELLNMNMLPFPGATFTVPTYRNASRSRHAGAEVGASVNRFVGLLARGDVRDQIAARVSYTYNRFSYVDDPIYADNDIPGAPRHYLNGEIRYEHPSGFSIAPSIEIVPQAYYVNSANTAINSAWTSVGARADWRFVRLGAALFVGANNLGNSRYSGSVQVDNAAGRYYEPADARTFYLGMRWDRGAAGDGR